MSSSLFKGIVIFILLIALAFVVGSLAADGAKFALVPIALICGFFGILLLGKHCWVLAFALPPLVNMLEISIVQNFPVGYIVSGFLLAYWLLMWVMGYVKVTWNSIPLLDIFTFIFIAYFLSTWVRHPVTLNVLVNEITHEGDAIIGGKEYIWCIAGACCYIYLSILKVDYQKVTKLLKIVFWISLPMVLINAVKIALLGGSGDGGGLEAAESHRFGALVGIGNTIYNFLLCKYGIIGIVCSPIKLFLLCFGGFCVALSGFRTDMLTCALVMFVTQYLHRQLLVALIPLFAGYLLMVYLAEQQMLISLPYGVKRVLSSLPGLDEIDKNATLNAEGSLNWRYVLWDLAMNPSAGYIRDYVWGDGFGQSSRDIKQYQMLVMRGEVTASMGHLQFARQGMWHSGYLTAIHRIGYVGLVMIIIWTLGFLSVMTRLFVGIARTKNCEYVYYFILSMSARNFVGFYFSAGTLLSIFNLFFPVALAKLLYCLAVKEGYITPLLQRKLYVPLMLREEAAEGKEASNLAS